MKILSIGFFITAIIVNFEVMANSTLKIALPIKQIQFDPQKIEDLYSMTVVNQIYAKLFKYLPDGQIQSDLVENWNVSKDKKTYTFKLKKMHFSDGSLITAFHVEYTLKRIFFIKAALSSDLSIIKGAKDFFKSNNLNDLKISAKDSQTLLIETDHPTGLLIYLLAVPDVGVLKLENPTSDFKLGIKTPFSGAYKLKEISTDKIDLQKWRPSDLDSQNPPMEIVFNLFDKVDPDKVALGLITDTSNFMTYDESKSSLDKNENWRPIASEATNERFIVMNPAKISLKIRRWMISKINSQEFIKRLGDKSIEAAFGFIPNILPGNLKSSKIKLMPDFKLEDKLKIKITYGENLPYPNEFKSYLLEVWKHHNLEFEFEALPVADYLNVLFKKKGTVVIGARGLDYPEGYSIITYFRSDLESNFFFVNNKAIDMKIDKASLELNNEKRYKIYQEIQEKVLDEATVIPLAFGSWKKYYWSNRVKAVPAHPIGLQFVPFEMLTMAEK